MPRRQLVGGVGFGWHPETGILYVPPNPRATPGHITQSMDRENPWKTLRTEIAFENAWIRIVKNDVINPSGNPGEYTFVDFKTRAVAVVPVDDQGNTRLVGQYRYAMDSYEWEVPAGGCPEGESLLECARRELREETGLIARDFELIHDGLQLSNSVTNERAYTFLARSLTQETAAPEETEELKVRTLPLEEAMEMAVDGTIKDAFSVVSLLKLKHLILRGELGSEE